MTQASPKPDVAEIVRGLTKARSAALLALSDQWCAGPELPKGVGGQRILWLLNAGLVEREFGDLSEAWATVPGGLKVRLSACWWFRLTPLGLAVRAALTKEPDDA